MLFHAISLFMRLKGNRIKPRAYQAATTNGYRHESRILLISSGLLKHFGNGLDEASVIFIPQEPMPYPTASGVMATCRQLKL
jgi:hypothetical protein